MKKTFLIIVIFIIAGLIWGHSAFQAHTQTPQEHQVLSATNTVVKKQAASASQSVISSDPGIPQTISIPKINLHANVESVAMDSQGRMGVPTNPDDTAWYSPGFRPGMNGSAVIDGHLDRVTGAPAVFWNLRQLSVGDNIIISEDNGHTYTFVVDDVEKYPYNQFPLSQVFGNADVPELNLITCNGVWDKNSKNYSDRLVVYSKLVAEN